MSYEDLLVKFTNVYQCHKYDNCIALQGTHRTKLDLLHILIKGMSKISDPLTSCHLLTFMTEKT